MWRCMDPHSALHLLKPSRGCLGDLACLPSPCHHWFRDLKWAGQRLPLLTSFQPFPPALFQRSHSAQPGAMGRKKIQISRIVDQRNRQVSPRLHHHWVRWHSGQGHSQAKQMVLQRSLSPEALLGRLRQKREFCFRGPIFSEENWTLGELQTRREVSQVQMETIAEKLALQFPPLTPPPRHTPSRLCGAGDIHQTQVRADEEGLRAERAL